MQAVKSKNTGPELAVRRLPHRMGYRFRLHRKDLPGKPDLVFPRLRKADDSATPQRGALVLPFSYRPLIHHGHDRLPALMDMKVVRPVRITMTIVSARITHVRRAVCF